MPVDVIEVKSHRDGTAHTVQHVTINWHELNRL
jgi:hypothetical protein